MIVYHFCRAADVPKLLAQGRVRSDGRHFVFERWDDIEQLFNATPEPEEYAALMRDVAPDMLVDAPISGRKLTTIRAEDLQQLQARSRYPEVDVNDSRVIDVKNGFGDSVLRRYIGIVNQETILFSGSVRENVLLAKPNATMDEIIGALDAANALEFVEQLPDGRRSTAIIPSRKSNAGGAYSAAGVPAIMLQFRRGTSVPVTGFRCRMRVTKTVLGRIPSRTPQPAPGLEPRPSP